MSIRVMSAVWSDMRIRSQAELLLLLALAAHARDDGVCWPSMRSIAAKARVDERSARRIVRRLAERGLITIIEQGGCDEDGRNVPNRYRVLAGETRQADGGTLCPPGGTVSQGIRGDRESPRGDSEDTDGGAYGPPRGPMVPLNVIIIIKENHQRRRLRVRVATLQKRRRRVALCFGVRRKRQPPGLPRSSRPSFV